MLAAIGTALSAPAPRSRLESRIVYPPKITSHRPDQAGGGDRDEDRDDPEHEQRQQRPEQDAVPRGQVAAGGVPDRAEDGDEPGRGPGGVPERAGSAFAYELSTGPSASQQQPEAEEKRRCELLGPSSERNAEAEGACESPEEEEDPEATAEVATDVCAERQAAECAGDEPHDLTEHSAHPIELGVVPVTDVDRAKRLYHGLG
jgi:hypothetical protein